jgi:hypothetical protein
MTPAFADHAVRRFAVRIATTIVTWAAVLSSVVLSVAFAQDAANSARNPPAASRANPPSPATDARGQAPIGHRQPRPSDLPSNVQRDEGGPVRSPVDQELDQKMQICRGC